MWLKVKKFNVNYIYEMIIHVSIDFTNLVYHLYQYVAGNETDIIVNSKRVEIYIITNM